MFVVYGKSSCLLTTLPCFCVLTAPSTRWAPCAKMRFLSATRQWDSKNNWLVGEHVTIHMSPVTIVYQIEPANWKKDIIFLLNGRMKRAKIELNHTKYNTVYIYSGSKHTHMTHSHTHTCVWPNEVCYTHRSEISYECYFRIARTNCPQISRSCRAWVGLSTQSGLL